MRKIVFALLAFLFVGTEALAQQNSRPIYDDTPQGGVYAQPVDSGGHPLPVSILGFGAGTTTYTKTTLTLNGASQVMLAASTTRNAMTVYNPSTNDVVWVDISGGTVAAEGGTAVLPGFTLAITGPSVPRTAITIVGTSAQSVIVQEGH